MQLPPVYVVGVAETQLGKVADQSELSMAALAAREALQEAGMSLSDVDGIFTNYMGEEGSVQIGEYLGIQPRFCDSTDIGGASFEAHVHHALLALATGRCEVALILYASRQRSRRNRSLAYGTGDATSLMDQFQASHHIPSPIGIFALLAARHMYDYGTTSEQLAEVAVSAREWAQLNPKAWLRDPLSVDDVLASPLLCDPLHRHDICLRTDGGGALVMTNQARAKGASKRPVRVLGAGEAHAQWSLAQMPRDAASPIAIAGREAFSMAAIGPEDVDVLEAYDAATITVLLQLEDLGFCSKGESGAFVEEGRLRPGGSLPSLTSGGGLSYCHPGALGLLLLIEGVRQARGEAGSVRSIRPKSWR